MVKPGEQLGVYRIERELGRGGMGVVMLALDTKLDREVAIKALPEALSQDPERLARFEREAKTLAQLNHPNVGGIHGVEERGGERFLVLEYVAGETLADRLDRGALAFDEAIELAVEIAAGVEAAHDAGVIHRDLKPGNIMVTPEGKAKVLDFGLARSEESSSSSILDVATMTSPAQHSPTTPGVILGTAAYMSPEQARGRRVGKHSDVWSFGVILYEMLTGASPFAGESAGDSIGAVLHKGIDLSVLPAGTPAHVRRVLERCLERDRELRYRDIGDVRIELLRADAAVAVQPAGRGARGAGWWAAAVAFAAACGVGGWLLAVGSREPEARPVRKFDAAVVSNGTTFEDAKPAISPDGSRVAYVAGEMIYVRELGSFESRAIEGTEGAEHVFWSPDGAWLGYLTRRSVHKVAAHGGTPIKLADSSEQLTDVAGGGWTASDRIVYALGTLGVERVSARGGTPEMAVERDTATTIDYHDVTSIPGTDLLLWVHHTYANSYQLEVFDGERAVVLMESEGELIHGPVYAPSGHVLYASGYAARNLWAVGFSLDEMRVVGEPFLVLADGHRPSVSRDGTLAVQRGGDLGDAPLVWVTPGGGVERISDPLENLWNACVSPDGKRVAVSVGAAAKNDVWVLDLERGSRNRLTFDEGFVMVVGWSPDGREIAVAELRPTEDEEHFAITTFHAADGSGATRDPISAAVLNIDSAWTIGVGLGDPRQNGTRISAVPLDASGDTRVVIESEHRFGGTALSPDGSLLAYSSDESGRDEVYCVRFPEGTGRWQASTVGGRDPKWSADGGTLFYQAAEGMEVMRVGVTREPSMAFGLPEVVFDGKELGLDMDMHWEPAPDGERFLAVQAMPENERDAAISVITNWFEEFRER